MKNFNASHFLSRELSWLEFNQRVLSEAQSKDNPLLERVKFFTITSSNLDEFFEVRVAGLKQQMESDVVERSLDGRTATETFKAVTRRVRTLVEEQFRCWREELVPELAKHGFHFHKPEDLNAQLQEWLDDYYRRQVRPVLTPLGIDPTHPFPQLLNKSLNIIVELEIEQDGEVKQRYAVVQVPRGLPRLVELPGDEDESHEYVFLSHLIGRHIADLFPGTEILGWWHFRVTRNSELYIDEEDAENLLHAVEEELRNRRRGAAVRLEVDHNCPTTVYQYLLETLELTEDDLYLVDGPLNPVRLMAISEGDHSPELREKPFKAPVAPALRDAGDLFAVLRQRDVLIHHPFENFSSVVDFLELAARDPHVLAIKQTLYRTGGDPRIIGALMDAVHNGKQVTAVVELKARFDEANNIKWARKLEEAGVHVVYGIVKHKVHAKMALVVRRDDDGLRQYVHFGTGNYNPTTARLYTDLSLLTTNPDFGEDATTLFNLLTGICQFQPMRKLLVAPFTLHEQILALIERETAHAKAGRRARILAKMNSLVDREVIEALYRASQAGVKIDLIVRGICCLRPGLEKVSENITVRSIVGRFLEHSRIFYFENNGKPDLFLSSSDWMPRNFFHRIEIAIPIQDPALRERIVNSILLQQVNDSAKAWELQPDGRYVKVKVPSGGSPLNSQEYFLQLAAGSKEPKPRKRAKKAARMWPLVQVQTKPS